MTEASMTNSNMTAPINTPQPVVDSAITPKTETPVTVDMTNIPSTASAEETTATEVKTQGFDTENITTVPQSYMRFMPNSGLPQYNINEYGDETHFDYNNINSETFKNQFLFDAENQKIFVTMQEKRNYLANKYPDYKIMIRFDELIAMGPDFRCFPACELEK